LNSAKTPNNPSNTNPTNNSIAGKTTEELVKAQGVIVSETGKEISKDNILKQEVMNENTDSNNLNIVDKKIVIKEEIKNNVSEISLKTMSSEIIKDDISAKIQNIKDIIKDIMSRTSIKGEGMEKVMDFIKSNINDFKMFNSISNEYYYLDLPVNKLGKEYPCKLIIKDNRKDNKKIDRTNVKVVVAVKTVNIGTVDGYLTVNNNNLAISLKCNEEFVKPLDLSKDKLIKPLQDMGFLVNISVDKKVEEVNLTSCRDFFDNSDQSSIDIKV
jgi:hypothetical protein